MFYVHSFDVERVIRWNVDVEALIHSALKGWDGRLRYDGCWSFASDMLSWPNKIASRGKQDCSKYRRRSLLFIRTFNWISIWNGYDGVWTSRFGLWKCNDGLWKCTKPCLLAIANSCFYHFPLHPLVIILTFLFRFYFIRGQHLVMGTFFVYICNVQRSEDWKSEVRVHTCRQPCAHGRRSFFRHSAISCAYGQ